MAPTALPTVALLGATGYTGRLVAAELARRGVPHRLGARSQTRLDALPGAAGQRRVVDSTDPAGLAGFLDGVDVLISTVGPFELLGRPVVAAAVRAGVAYVDSTGELDFLRDVYATHADAPVAVVPACGFDYVPGDLAAALAAADLAATGRAVEEVVVGYRLTGMTASRGTARSGLGAARTAALRPHRRTLPFPDGDRAGLELPWGEPVMVPRHLPGVRAVTAFAVPAPVALGAAALAPLASLSTLGWKVASPVLERLVERLPEGPPESVRRQSRFGVLATASGAGRPSRVLVEGSDVYGLTARLLVEVALRLPRSGRTGALTPAQAVEPAGFLDAVAADVGGEGTLSWRLL